MSPSSDEAIGHPAGTAAALGTAPNAAAERPSRPLLRAVLWLFAAELASLCGAALAGAVVGVSQGLAHAHGGTGWHPNPLLFALVSTLALQATMLYAALKQGRSLGDGNLAIGLGAAPIRRPWLLVLFAVLAIAWLLGFVAMSVHFQALRAHLATHLPSVPSLRSSGDPGLRAIQLLLLVAVAPIAEELFFRGWLWTALRRSWSVWPTALCTAGLWLGVHAVDAPLQALVLVPMAILLSLARHHGGSVRASLVLHVANNTVVAAIQLAGLLIAAH